MQYRMFFIISLACAFGVAAQGRCSLAEAKRWVTKSLARGGRAADVPSEKIKYLKQQGVPQGISSEELIQAVFSHKM